MSALDGLVGYKVIVHKHLPAGTIVVSEDVWAAMKQATENPNATSGPCPRCGSTSLGSEPDSGSVRCGPCGLPVGDWAAFNVSAPKTLLGYPVVVAPEDSLPPSTIVFGTRQSLVDCPHCKKETRAATGMCTHCGRGIGVGTHRTS